MKTAIDLNRRNFYATWFNLLTPPAWARRKGYGICGIIYLPPGQGSRIRPVISVRNR